MPQADSAFRHVFVYGTLRAGGSNDIRRYRPTPILVGDTSVDGVLYDLGAYPGLVLGSGAPVRGEVYRIAAAVESELDRLESVADDDNGEYIRRELDVALAGRAVRCLVYEIHPSRIDGKPVIAGGDWLAHNAVPKAES